MKTFKELKSISDIFFRRCENIVSSKPWAVCLAMHEYARNLYPQDPFIPFQKGLCPTERLYGVTNEVITFLDHTQKFGHYKILKQVCLEKEIKKKTGIVYGNLWSKFSFEHLVDDTIRILGERLRNNRIGLNFLKGKKSVDIGCGSGRFTIALKRMGCSSIVGIDYGDEGLRIARALLKKTKISGVKFLKHSVLELPFRDGTFDFVFCNGVLHHTENLERGIKEMVRVAKEGGKIWLYLYGEGGIFWYARKKMPLIMKKIPQKYTMAVLDIIGMPNNRFIFCDNWYVPIEKHSTDKQIRKILKYHGIKEIYRLQKGRSTDLEYYSLHGGEIGKIMWGDGELRYILQK